MKIVVAGMMRTNIGVMKKITVAAMTLVTGMPAVSMMADVMMLDVTMMMVANAMMSDDNEQGRCRFHGRVPTKYVNATCQICKIHGHAACDCWWRYGDDRSGDEENNKDDKAAHVASYGVGTNWYTDTGATHHLTRELSKLHV
jgi:hypothetical protein